MSINNWEPQRKRQKKQHNFQTIPPNRFYNRNLEEIHNQNTDENRVRKKEKVLRLCKIFRKQYDAFLEIESVKRKNIWLKKLESTDSHRIFCLEMKPELIPILEEICSNIDEVGQLRQTRFFLVCNFKTFFRHYNEIPLEHRHFYEVITENSHCHLYFDIERPQFEGSDYSEKEERMINLFLELLLKEVQDELGLHVNQESLPIVDLQSSTNQKISHHIIVKLDDGECVFENNDHMKNFVKNFISGLRIHDGEKTDEIGNLLFYDSVKKGRNNRPDRQIVKCVIDDAVYTKNRHFRLLWSCKIEKKPNRPRRTFVVKRNDSILRVQQNYRRPIVVSDEEIFYSTLVTNVDTKNEDLKKIVFLPHNCKNIERERMIYGSNTGFDIRRRRRLREIERASSSSSSSTATTSNTIIPPPPPPPPPPRPQRDLPHLTDPSLRLNLPLPPRFEFDGRRGGRRRERIEQRDFPRLLTHILEFWNHKAGLYGSAREIFLYPGTRVIVVFMGGPNRYCERIGRHHRSNHIHLVVNLASKKFYQKCTDEECKDFRSTLYDIPDHVMDPIPRRFT